MVLKFLSVYVCLQVPREAREDVGSSGPGFASACELNNVDAGKQLRTL